MNNSYVLRKNEIIKILLLDTISVILVYAIPALSHITYYPLYIFDPMRLIVLLGFMVYRNKWNSCILALTLPLVSFLLSGHPVAIKNGLIAVELLINVLLLSYMINKRSNTIISLVISIVASKFVYYVFKYIVITSGLLRTELIATDWIYQVIVVAIICLSWLAWDKKNDSKNNEHIL